MPESAEIEDRLARIAMGDRAAFRVLYAEHAPRLFGICMRILRDRAEAEDALQTVFQRIWTGADQAQAAGLPPMVWLVNLARDTALSHRRSLGAASQRPCEDERLPGPPDGLSRSAASLQSDRAVMVRRAYLDGDGYDALSRRAGVSAGAFRIWFRRCLMQLREDPDQ